MTGPWLQVARSFTSGVDRRRSRARCLGGKVVEKRGRNRAQRLSLATAAKRPNQAETVASSRDQSPPTSHGKGRVDATSLLLKRGVTFLAPQRETSPANPRAGRTGQQTYHCVDVCTGGIYRVHESMVLAAAPGSALFVGRQGPRTGQSSFVPRFRDGSHPPDDLTFRPRPRRVRAGRSGRGC